MDIISNHSSILSPKQVVNTYIVLMREYIDAFCKFTAETSAIQYDCMFYVGLNVINKVYEFMLLKYGNIKNANYYSQKSYVYFIEYMEQIYQHGLSQTINHNDAILFIYKKTIFETSDSGTASTNDTMGNIFSLQPMQVVPNMEDCIKPLQTIHQFINCLLYWDNIYITTANRIHICTHLLPLFLKFENHYEMTQVYLEYLRNVKKMSYDDYACLLTEICTLLEISVVSNMDNLNEILIEKFYIEKHILCKKIEDNDITDLVRWLYEPVIL